MDNLEAGGYPTYWQPWKNLTSYVESLMHLLKLCEFYFQISD
jgi:hypothetical protein